MVLVLRSLVLYAFMQSLLPCILFAFLRLKSWRVTSTKHQRIGSAPQNGQWFVAGRGCMRTTSIFSSTALPSLLGVKKQGSLWEIINDHSDYSFLNLLWYVKGWRFGSYVHASKAGAITHKRKPLVMKFTCHQDAQWKPFELHLARCTKWCSGADLALRSGMTRIQPHQQQIEVWVGQKAGAWSRWGSKVHGPRSTCLWKQCRLLHRDRVPKFAAATAQAVFLPPFPTYCGVKKFAPEALDWQQNIEIKQPVRGLMFFHGNGFAKM